MKINFNGTSGKINFNGTNGVIHFGDPNRYVNPTVVMYQIYVSAGNYTTIARVTDHNESGTIYLLCDEVTPPVEEYQITAGNTEEVPVFTPESGTITTYSQIRADVKTASEIIQTSHTLVTSRVSAPTVQITSHTTEPIIEQPGNFNHTWTTRVTNNDAYPITLFTGVAINYPDPPTVPSPGVNRGIIQPGAFINFESTLDWFGQAGVIVMTSAEARQYNIAGTLARQTSTVVSSSDTY